PSATCSPRSTCPRPSAHCTPPSAPHPVSPGRPQQARDRTGNATAPPGPPEPGCAAAAPPTTSTSSSSTAAVWPEKTPHGYAPRGQPHSTQGCSPPDCPPSPPKQCGSPTTGTCSPNSPWTRQT